MTFELVKLIVFLFFFFNVIISVIAAIKAGSNTKKNTPFNRLNSSERMGSFVEHSHKWHATEGEIGEEHVDRIGHKPIRHEKPETGYVILNGQKYPIKECKDK